MPPQKDLIGVDLFVYGTEEIGGDVPLLAIQVKSWSVPREHDGHWQYNGLSEKQFNRLAGPLRTIPRLLALVVVPPDATQFGDAKDDRLMLRKAAYWLSLRDREKIPEATDRKVQVRVPQRNLLTVDTMKWLCEHSAQPYDAATTARTS
jgi:hypothetical protein